jgi:hypothetical protein
MEKTNKGTIWATTPRLPEHFLFSYAEEQIVAAAVQNKIGN